MNPNHLTSPPSAPAEDFGYGSGDTGSSGKVAEAREKISRTTHGAAEHLKATATEAAARAKHQAEHYVAEQRETAAGRIRGYSSALHESARSFEEQDPNIAHFAHMAADRVQQVADYVRNCDLHDLRQDAEEAARRHPALFFGGLFAVGVVLGNMATASRRRQSSDASFEAGPQDDWRTRAEPDFTTPANPIPPTPPVPEL
jgi:hypothetical protein